MSSSPASSIDLYANNSYRTTVAVCFGVALPVVSVSFRLIARRKRGLSLAADDYMIVFAAVCAINNMRQFYGSERLI